MNSLNTELKARAISYGLCQQWQNGWQRSKSDQELIDMFIRGIDFCIENDYPTNDFILANFNSDLLLANNIYVNRSDINSHGGKGVYVVQGDSCGSFTFQNFEVATIYVRHQSDIHIEAKDVSKVFIHIYDSAKVEFEQRDCAKVFVYHH